MNIKLLKEEKYKLVFVLDKINEAVANTLRRYLMNHVAVLAVDEVEIKDNSSGLYDEMIAHRIGLIPIKTDLKSYNMMSECKCEGKGCEHCQLKFTLKAKGPCTVYSKDLEGDDPKCVPVYDNIPITILLKGQELKLEATAILGQGKDHAKFSPGLMWYRGYPELEITKESNIKEALSKIPEYMLMQKGNSLEIKDILKWNESYEEMLEKNKIKVNSSKEKFIFYLESWEQITAKELLVKAIDIYDESVGEFEKLVKKIK